jgi:hypothetical protein
VRKRSETDKDPNELDEFEQDMAFAALIFGDDCEADLEEGLTTASSVYDSGNPRAAAIEALRVVIAHIEEELPEAVREPRLLNPLAHTLRALEALNDGFVDPMFRALPRIGGSELDCDQLKLRVFVAMVVTLLRSAGISRDDAAETVQRKLKQLRITKQRKHGYVSEISEGTIHRWVAYREEYQKRLVILSGKNIARHISDVIRQVPDAFRPLPPAGPALQRFAANALLNHGFPVIQPPPRTSVTWPPASGQTYAFATADPLSRRAELRRHGSESLQRRGASIPDRNPDRQAGHRF